MKSSIKPAQVDAQFRDDPRIDSPEIEVRPVQTKEIPVVDPVVEVIEPIIDEVPKQEEHECSVGFQDALKQNLLPILGMLFGAFLLGFLLGKK